MAKRQRKRGVYIVSGVITAKCVVRQRVGALDEKDALDADPKRLAQFFAPLAASDWTYFYADLEAVPERRRHGKAKA